MHGPKIERMGVESVVHFVAMIESEGDIFTLWVHRVNVLFPRITKDRGRGLELPVPISVNT